MWTYQNYRHQPYIGTYSHYNGGNNDCAPYFFFINIRHLYKKVWEKLEIIILSRPAFSLLNSKKKVHFVQKKKISTPHLIPTIGSLRKKNEKFSLINFFSLCVRNFNYKNTIYIFNV
jgi:hypothetical protein